LQLVATSPNRHQELRLFARYNEHGDASARDEIIRRTLPLAKKLAKRYASGAEPIDDLLQVASIGLIKAVDRFDPARGTAFSTFAVPCILGELKRHFRDTGWAAHVPRAVQERALRVQAATERLATQLSRSPTAAEVAAATGESLEDVLEAMEAATAHDSVSLDTPLSRKEDGGTYADSVGEIDHQLELIEYRSVVNGTIRALPERERELLALRFGEDMTQSEIAARVGISQMHVSRLIRRTLNRLTTVAEA
jgi:RNA polymerase sigma-B factor